MELLVPGCLMISKIPLFSDCVTCYHVYTNFKIGGFLIRVCVCVCLMSLENLVILPCL